MNCKGERKRQETEMLPYLAHLAKCAFSTVLKVWLGINIAVRMLESQVCSYQEAYFSCASKYGMYASFSVENIWIQQLDGMPVQNVAIVYLTEKSTFLCF